MRPPNGSACGAGRAVFESWTKGSSPKPLCGAGLGSRSNGGGRQCLPAPRPGCGTRLRVPHGAAPTPDGEWVWPPRRARLLCPPPRLPLVALGPSGAGRGQLGAAPGWGGVGPVSDATPVKRAALAAIPGGLWPPASWRGAGSSRDFLPRSLPTGCQCWDLWWGWGAETGSLGLLHQAQSGTRGLPGQVHCGMGLFPLTSVIEIMHIVCAHMAEVRRKSPNLLFNLCNKPSVRVFGPFSPSDPPLHC